MTIELIYLDGKGKGQFIRNLLQYFKVPFKDTRVTDIDESLRDTLPYGQLPYFIESDGNGVISFSMAQCTAIVRYLSKKFEFRPSTAREQAMADEILESTQDLLIYNYYLREPKEKERFRSYTIPKILGRWEGRLEQNDPCNCLIGCQLTFADLCAFTAIDELHLMPIVEKSFPKLTNLCQHFYNSEIGDYLKSESIQSLTW
ncbi:putative glutathione S-transferase [Tieghemostelium lacteum]|uniref:Putative glutathione S-transferase n=1 Tax=Tieghemostelium lacteum TaxID=361077 RepID=A0A152A5D2_TIELA|nr:putative glutathione S-transferase [Tieghemostelium lacteum]|eukprot:KYR01429.1 putative glutathione S-transferase [Tieghemostelium lacteum]